MTTIADRVAGPPLAGPTDAIARDAAAAAASLPAISFPVGGERELRLDLFRGLALWLIFIDHLPNNLLTWFTIRNYGFSDATEIFIFISGYTAAFVYGRAMLEAGFVVATARILRRAWQIYVAHVFLFTIFLAEISYVATSFENPLYSEEMGIMDFLKQPDVTIVQALLLRFRPVNMDVLPLYIVLMLFLPLILWVMKWRADVMLALSVLLYVITWQYALYLTAYPNGFWAFNPLAWQLLFVFGAWCALGGEHEQQLPGQRIEGPEAVRIGRQVQIVLPGDDIEQHRQRQHDVGSPLHHPQDQREKKHQHDIKRQHVHVDGTESQEQRLDDRDVRLLEKIHDAHFFRVQRVLETGGDVGNLREKDREQKYMGDINLPDPPQDARGRHHETGLKHRAAVYERRGIARDENENLGGA